MTEDKSTSTNTSGTDDGAVERRAVIMNAAAQLFAEKGFAAATMREIATKTGILAGSIYYHFPSKEELYVTVVLDALGQLSAAVKEAIASSDDPWQQLDAAARTHCTVLLETPEIAAIFTPQYFAQLNPASRQKIVVQRDLYEAMLEKVVDRLDIDPEVDRRLFRIHLLGALNWTTFWYQPSFGLTPAEIGGQLVRMLRTGRFEGR